MKKKIIFVLGIVLAISLCFVGCGSDSASGDASYMPEYESGVDSSVLNSVVDGEIDQKIIYNDSISIEVGDVEAVIASYEELLDGYGYIETQNLQLVDSKMTAELSIKLKTEYRTTFLDEIDKSGDVYSLYSTSENVTLEYVQLENTLNENQTLMEYYKQKYEDALADDSSQTLIDSYYEKYTQYVTALAKATAEYNALVNQVDYSTITISMYEIGSNVALTKNYSSKLAQALGDSWTALANVLGQILLIIIYVFPFALVAGAITVGVIFIRKKLKKVFDRKKPIQQNVPNNNGMCNPMNNQMNNPMNNQRNNQRNGRVNNPVNNPVNNQSSNQSMPVNKNESDSDNKQ